jgi:signal transduction histidine kinase
MSAVSDIDRPPVRPPSPVGPPVIVASADEKPRAAWTLARVALVVVVCINDVVALSEVWQTGKGIAGTAVAVVLMATMLALQLFHFSRPGADLRSRRSFVLLGLFTILAYVPILEYGFSWISLPQFVAGCALLVLRPVPAWLSFAGVMASVLAIRLIGFGEIQGATPFGSLAYGVLDSAVFSIVVYLLTRLAGLVEELHSARDETAHLAIAQERLRFARDLHELIGLNLSAINLKGELAHRLLTKYPNRAKRELAEILRIARRALADVRATATNYRERSLAVQVGSAESVLRASGIDVTVEGEHTDLPPQVCAVFGAALREGVTTVLRHSDVQRCEIAIRRIGDIAYLEMVSEGMTGNLAADPAAGKGIREITDRIAALHGQIATETLDGGRYRLYAEVPLLDKGQRSRSRFLRRLDWRRSQVATTLPLNARMILTLVTVTFTAIIVGSILHLLLLTQDVSILAPGCAYLVAALVLQLAYFSRPRTRLRSPTGYALLFAQACVTYLPIVQMRGDWVTPGWVGGNALLILPTISGWAVFAATVAVAIWRHVVSTGQPLDILFSAAATVNTGFIAYGLTRLTKLIAELDTSRTRLATMAVAQERLRFARDLHDLLGLSLSAITLKCELTQRLVQAAPAKAATELTEILNLARRALPDVRSVAGSYRELSLDGETRSARSVLAAADIAVRVNGDHDGLPADVGTVLAVVLREAVTNVLRHSNAKHCDIALNQTAGHVHLTITNDNPAPGAAGGHHGNGTRNLCERVVQLGGRLRSGVTADGRYELAVSLPL